MTREARVHLALTCLEDLESAGLVIAFTEPPGTAYARGGRHVEYGVAVANDLPVLIVGPRENVFHCLPATPAFPTWAEALAYLHDDRQRREAERAALAHQAITRAAALDDDDTLDDEDHDEQEGPSDE